MKYLIVAAFACFMFTVGCEELITTVEPSDETTEERDVQAYESIQVNSSVDMVLKVTSDRKVKIKAGKQMIKYIRTYVKAGVLEIDVNNIRSGKKKPVIYVSIEDIKFIVNKGSGNITIEYGNDDDDCKKDDDDDDGDDDDNDSTGGDPSDTTGGDPSDTTGGDPSDTTGGDPSDTTGSDTTSIQMDEVFVFIMGSGDVTLNNVEIGTLNTSIKGSGKLNVSGSIDKHVCEIRGSGDLNALEAPTRELYIKIKGSGSARVHVLELLNAEITGSGKLEYKGDPLLESVVTGSGVILKLL